MMYAMTGNGRSEASPEEIGSCPGCGETVRSKCGTVNAWHWAHLPESRCEAARYGMTEWHVGWLRRFPKEKVEVSVTSGGVRHRADAIIGGKVIEFQRKMMPSAEMDERETFWRSAGYGFVWVFDGREAWESERLFLLRDKGTHYTFRWKRPPRTLRLIRRPFLVDLDGNDMMRVRWITDDGPLYGTAEMIEKKESYG